MSEIKSTIKTVPDIPETRSDSVIKPLWHSLISILAVAAVYFIAARLSLYLAFENSNASPVWPPSGIAFAAMLLLGNRIWPGITLGAFLANVVNFIASQAAELTTILWVSAGISVGNTLEAVVGVMLLRRLADVATPFDSVQNVFGFVTVALLMCMVSCTIGPTTLTLAGIAPWSAYTTIWFTWWLGDVVGVLLLTPVLLLWWHERRAHSATYRLRDQIFMLVILFVLCQMTFAGWFDIPLFTSQAYMLLPVLLWLVFRLGQRDAATAVALVSLLAIWGTIHGRGPFYVSDSLNESLLSLQAFVAVIILTMMALAAALSERARAESALKCANESLEQRVAARTIELAEINRQLETANKELICSNQELDDFAYVASHDLKEPLRGISNICSFLLEDYGDRICEGMQQKLERLPVLASKLDKLISSLLYFSRTGRQELTFVPTDLNLIVEDVVGSLQEMIIEHDVDIRIPKTLPTVTCDIVRVGEIYRNLITNAIKYNNNAGKWVEVGAKQTDNSPLCFYVQDNGIGIHSKHFDKIFQIFKRLHAESRYGGGTGAGMTIVKKIVERHGGQIWLESHLDQGSTFYFTLSGAEHYETADITNS